MHEYPLAIYFAVFVLLLWHMGDPSLIFLALLAFISGLFAHKLFSFLRLEKYHFPDYPYVYIFPVPFKLAFAIGNAIVISRGLVQKLPEDVVKAIIYHEVGHIKFKDFTTVFLLIFVFSLITTYSTSKIVLFAYLLLFFWIYWHMEARADLYAMQKSPSIEKALETFNLKWRLAFLKGNTTTHEQTIWIILTIIFFAGVYLGKLIVTSYLGEK